jgi:hypothetical protein
MADGTIPAPTRVCIRCKQEKPATAEFFHRDSRLRDGLCYACKPCLYQRRLGPPGPIKRCTKCGQEKPATAEFFYREKKGRGGLFSRCKVCVSAHGARYRADNPLLREVACRRWAAEHPERILEYRRKQRKRLLKDGRNRASSAMSRAMRHSLNGKDDSKNGASWEKLAGYTRAELVTHLERQFSGQVSWNNFGKKWHIDHILPVSSFTFSNCDDPDFRACWSLANLRPLLKRDNLIKGCRRTHLI